MENVVVKQSLSVFCTICSILIGFIALFIPPKGVIDSSVLWYTAQMLLFVAAMLGVNLQLPFVGSNKVNQ